MRIDMKDLQLPLIKKWFDLTKAGIKTEDYREINSRYKSRFLILNGEKKSMEYWKYMEVDELSRMVFNITFQLFSSNIMTLGYPKKGDPERTIQLEHKGISIDYGNPEWGAEPGKLYFVIKHGKIL